MVVSLKDWNHGEEKLNNPVTGYRASLS